MIYMITRIDDNQSHVGILRNVLKSLPQVYETSSGVNLKLKAYSILWAN